MSTKERLDVYQIVTDKVITMLEAGTIPWHKPWQTKGGQSLVPRNLISGRAYRGVNLFLLAYSPYNNPYWLTFKQAQSRGASVRKGEHGTLAVFWKLLEDIDKTTGKCKMVGGEKKLIPMLRYYTIFNAEQCDHLETPYRPEVSKPEEPPFDAIPACEAIVSNWPNPCPIEHGGDRAAYSPVFDRIRMPAKVDFISPETYYVTLFHEMTHATGHGSRLKREFGSAFGNESYSKEELIAEMGGAFLCAFGGISSTLDQSAAYLKGWLSMLKGDKKLIVCAAAAAQKAADSIMGTVQTASSGSDEE